MPAMAHTGQEFHVTGFLDNPDNPLYSVPTFFILEVYSDFWFWPDWSHFDPSDPSTVTYTNEEIPTGTKILEVIASFTWPETGPDTITGLRFWGAMLNDDMNVIRGDFAVQEWGYGP